MHSQGMLNVRAIKTQDLAGLNASQLFEVAAQLLSHIGEQSKHIGEQRKQIDSQAQAIKWRDAKIQSVTFELARFKAWKFGAKTEAMNAEQRALFEETCAADQADLEARLAELQRQAAGERGSAPHKQPRGQPKREALPPHLPRVDQRVEPENTMCPTPECGQPMVRVGEDISERLDVVPAQFFVQRQIRGKWACKCCQLMVQEPAASQVFDNALPTPGLQAHTVVSRFVDHIPYHRQELMNARGGVHTPRSTLAGWGGQTGAQMMPLFDAHRHFVLGSRVVHADETPIAMLDPGAGKTKKGYMWAYARGGFDADPGVVYDFCLGRGGKYPHEFLKGWSGTLVVDAYGGYAATLSLEGRVTANCLAHSRRKFDELFKANASPVAAQAIQRIALLYRIEADARHLTSEQRLQMRQERSKPLWEELHVWLQLERLRVPTGTPIAKAIDYSLKIWDGLSRFLADGDVPVDNNHIENQMRPWALGRKNWLFIGSQLAGERAGVVMSLLQSAKLNGHDPFAYLKDVLTRLPTQLNSRIEELLPHRWEPAHCHRPARPNMLGQRSSQAQADTGDQHDGADPPREPVHTHLEKHHQHVQHERDAQVRSASDQDATPRRLRSLVVLATLRRVGRTKHLPDFSTPAQRTDASENNRRERGPEPTATRRTLRNGHEIGPGNVAMPTVQAGQ